MTGLLVSTVPEKLHDDFSTADVSPNWDVVLGTGQTIDWATASAVRILAGTAAGETVMRSKKAYEAPFRVQFFGLAASMISQRVANQEIELRIATKDGREVASWLFNGTTAANAKLRSGNGGVNAADASVGTGIDTGTGTPAFEILITPDEVQWHAKVADSSNPRSYSNKRDRRIPDPNIPLYVEVRVRNTGTVASSTIVAFDTIKITDINELTAEITGGQGGGSASQSIPVSVVGAISTLNNIGAVTPGTGATQLGKSEDAAHASGDVGVMQLAVRQPAAPAAVTSAAGDYSPTLVDAEGKMINAGQADPALSFQTVSTLTTATAVAARAAQAAGIRTFVTDIVASNSSATGVKVIVLDNTTPIWSVYLAPGASVTKALATPLRGTAATALNLNLSAAVTDVTVSLSGYSGV